MIKRTAVAIMVTAVMSLGASMANAAPRRTDARPHGPTAGPTVGGPVATPTSIDRVHGVPYTSSAIDLRSHGYTESEYFVSGTAQAYNAVGALGTNGEWTVTPSTTAPYKTRIIVRRPIDMKKFSGHVIVEWMNASTGRDLDVGWTFGSNEMLHSGDIYVGVTTQGLPITSPTGLKAWDPTRYGSLSIPDDEYSYDIFSQVGEALRSPQNAAILGGAQPQDLIAYGDSQSAFRLVTYLDAIQPRDHVYNGFLVQSRFGMPAPLNDTTTPPDGTIIRSDTGAKVITLETESDIARPSDGFLGNEQPDSSSFRLWEIAGGSHISADEELLQRIQAFKEYPTANPPVEFNVCGQQTDDLDEGSVVDTAIHDLGAWDTQGTAPPSFPLLDVSGTGSTASYVLNVFGDTIGGIRLPQITVPIETLHGLGNTGDSDCALEGVSVPYSTAQLQDLYPTHADYVAKFTRAARAAVRAGILQRYDAQYEIQQAENSSVPAPSNIP